MADWQWSSGKPPGEGDESGAREIMDRLPVYTADLLQMLG